MKIRYVFIICLIILLASCGAPHEADEPSGEDMPQIPVVEIEEPDDESNEGPPYYNFASPPIPNYVIDLEIMPEERRVAGVAGISFQNTSAFLLDRVFFNLPFAAFTEGFARPPIMPAFEGRVFQHGRYYGLFDINTVTVNLAAADFAQNGTVLTVYLEEYLPPGAALEIGLIFQAEIPRISHRTGGNDYAMWFGNFLPMLSVFSDGHWHIYPYYPVGSPFFTSISNFEVNIVAPTDFTIVSTGLERRSEANGIATTSVLVNHVRDFAFAALAPGYNSRRVITDTGIDISIYYHSDWEDTAALDGLLAAAHAAFDYFEARVGSYPYQSFDIVETELFINNSIKYPGITFVDSRRLRTPAAHDAIARDIGHQWFYNVVGNNPVSEGWLSYGLVAFLLLGMNMDEQQISTHMQGLHYSLQNLIADMEHPELSRGLSFYNSWSDFHNIQFLRGKLLFYALWQRMGHEDFDIFLRAYYQRYAFEIAAADGLIAMAEEIYGGDLMDFFDDWLNSRALPEID